MKLFLDVPNVIVILAVDKEVINRGVEVRYGKFRFARERARAIGAEYLEKIIQLPIVLPPLGQTKVKEYIEKLPLPAVLDSQKDLLVSLLPPNPRKIKRTLNALLLARTVFGASAEDLDILTRLAVLQVQDDELFAAISAAPEDRLEALQIYYAAKKNQSQPNFNDFQQKSAALMAFCEANYRPDSYLTTLMRSDWVSPAIASGRLAAFMTLLGS